MLELKEFHLQFRFIDDQGERESLLLIQFLFNFRSNSAWHSSTPLNCSGQIAATLVGPSASPYLTQSSSTCSSTTSTTNHTRHATIRKLRRRPPKMPWQPYSKERLVNYYRMAVKTVYTRMAMPPRRIFSSLIIPYSSLYLLFYLLAFSCLLFVSHFLFKANEIEN